MKDRWIIPVGIMEHIEIKVLKKVDGERFFRLSGGPDSVFMDMSTDETEQVKEAITEALINASIAKSHEGT